MKWGSKQAPSGSVRAVHNSSTQDKLWCYTCRNMVIVSTQWHRRTQTFNYLLMFQYSCFCEINIILFLFMIVRVRGDEKLSRHRVALASVWDKRYTHYWQLRNLSAKICFSCNGLVLPSSAIISPCLIFTYRCIGQRRWIQ